MVGSPPPLGAARKNVPIPFSASAGTGTMRGMPDTNPQQFTDEHLIEKVAREVMGFPSTGGMVSYCCYGQTKVIGPSTLQGHPRQCLVCGNECKLWKRSKRWNPLTDWNHTMEVVERMETQWHAHWRLSDSGAAFEVMSTPYQTRSRRLQRAICLAALRAVGALAPPSR
jgi:hypothetical protein